MSLNYFVAPQVAAFLEEKARDYGPGLSGALFGAGWWFWVDACAASGVNIPFVQYLPGVVATLALIMINCIRRDELQEYDAFDEGVFFRSRFWLLMSYIVSIAAIGGSVAVLLKDYALDTSVQTAWPGVAGLCQTTLILGSALLFFVSRLPGDTDGSYSAYSSF
ncbi:hypothetical protein WJX84_001365 [Apatococcus fuscideae]|uniref:Uncharacterized protein n=1 Tax=Apatococcus fuscideae TaxID=2026836 RepID=A0AAW1SLI6_9CHLO